MNHVHQYHRVSSDVPDYWQCQKCGKQVDEIEAADYAEAIDMDLKEQEATGN